MIKTTIKELRYFLILWVTQSLSTLGSSITSFALILWSYQEQGSALTTALLSVCSYAPYVIMSIFAGALSDKWSKKAIMLVSDTFAAVCTVTVLTLFCAGQLRIWHLYALNALSGLMNTVQQPASDVAVSLLTPKKYYQKISGMRSFSNSLNSILAPSLAAAIFAFAGLKAVIVFDLITFVIAFSALLFFVKIPDNKRIKSNESFLSSSKSGLEYLFKNRGILDLILFLAMINFTASMFNAVLPARLIPTDGGNNTYGLINTVSGAAMLAGSVLVSVLPAPKSRVRAICNSLLLSMSTENFMLAFGRSVPVWCIGSVLGWICIPVMNGNMDTLFRGYIPIHMQGRVYSARNTLQFFTIPIGYVLGGFLVDKVFEPFMAVQQSNSIFCVLFGAEKGSGAAFMLLILGFVGVATCLVFRKSKNIWKVEK